MGKISSKMQLTMAIILRESAACPTSLVVMTMMIYAVFKAVVISGRAPAANAGQQVRGRQKNILLLAGNQKKENSKKRSRSRRRLPQRL